MKLTGTQAFEVLGMVPGPYDAELIQMAFRKRCKQYHPDILAVQNARGILPRWTVDQLREARDTLLNRCNVGEFACKTCKGSGTVRYRMGTRPCGACKGTGETHGS